MRRLLLWLCAGTVLLAGGVASVAVANVSTPPPFTASATPTTITASAGTSVQYALTITRNHFAGTVSFALAGLPPASTYSFSPASTTGTSSTLQVTTTAATPPNAYPMTVTATSGGTASSVAIKLNVSAGQTGKHFTISGVAAGALAPGVSAPINLAITNPNAVTLNVTNLTVTLAGTTTSSCAINNYAVTQFSGTYPVAVPAGATRTLSQLGIGQAAWPSIRMLNLATNQDACRGTAVQLAYTGTGTGG
jgi:hypothetical protein